MTEGPDPTRVVADVDVLAADLFVDGTARNALSVIRTSPSLTLVLTAALVAETRDLIAELGDDSVATDWADRIRGEGFIVEATLEGHPAFAAADAADAATVLSHDSRLQTAGAGVAIRAHVETSVKSPDAFVSLVEGTAFDRRS